MCSHDRSLLVVGIDGSNTSWRALHYAFGLARRQGGFVVAVFAFTPITSCAIIVGAGEALSHKLFGSKAARTIRRSRCPVIVVP
jgi:hypothetical protein